MHHNADFFRVCTGCQDKGTKRVEIKNRCNQAQHLTQDTESESDKTQENITHKKTKWSTNLGREILVQYFLKIITWTPKYTNDHPGLTVSNWLGNSIGNKGNKN